jgi:hypothetical protein
MRGVTNVESPPNLQAGDSAIIQEGMAMSFIGRNGFFGAMTPYIGPYHHSVYAKYSRGGGSENAAGTLGKAFAYKRPRFSDGGAADDADPYDSDIQNIEAATQPSQPRRPGQVEGMMQAINQWVQGPSGISQRFANSGLYDIQRASASLQESVDPDTADKIQKYTDKITDKAAAADPDTPGLPPLKQRAQGGNVMAGKMRERRNPYEKPPHNNANNDHHQGHTMGRDGQSYSWGKVSPDFQNQGAEITPHGHNQVTPRKLAHGGGCTCWRCGGRFARGGQAQIASMERPPVCSLTAHAQWSGIANPCATQRARLSDEHSLERCRTARNQFRPQRRC